MEKVKKLFGDISLTWIKVIIFAIIAGVYTAIMAMIPAAKDTSFADLTISFEVWILFGILIIMNSKSAVDSALKCFIFFLISQPLVYIVQDVVNKSNFYLFRAYYRNWVMWTIATIPMGFIGYYMKKDKWWGLIILTPILVFLGFHLSGFIQDTMFSFPRHILSAIFCIVTLIIYPLVIFKNKKLQIIGCIISSIIIIVMAVLAIVNPPIYSTEILSNNEEHRFDNTYKVYFIDKKYGDLSIINIIDSWMVHGELKKAGKAEFILESPDGEKSIFEIDIKRNTYHVERKK